MDILSALKSLEGFELKGAEFIAWPGEVHATDPEAPLVFHHMFLQQRASAHLIQFEKRLVRKNPRLFGEVDLNSADIDAALAGVKKMMENRRPPELADDVRLAVEPESASADLRYRKIINKTDTPTSRLLESLGTSSRQQRCELCEFGTRRGYPPPVHAVSCPAREAQASCRRRA